MSREPTTSTPLTERQEHSARFSPLSWSVPLVLLLLLIGAAIGSGTSPSSLQIATAASPTSSGSSVVGTSPADEAVSEELPAAPGPGPGATEQEGGQEREPDPGPPLLARRGSLLLHVPTESALVVGFHEAATTDGLELEPIGQLTGHRNTTRVTAPPDDPAGGPYLIMHSRGRAAAATSAVDIVMTDDDPVLSPVTGQVSDVRSFLLGGQYRDARIEIVPDDAPQLRVVVIHVDDVKVAEGDRVVATETTLAGTARRFPFFSQIDQDTDPDRWPHVHLEVKGADAPRPGG